MNESGSQLLSAILHDASKRCSAAIKMDKVQTAGRIAGNAWDITEKDRTLSLEFLAGQHFDRAAGAAYDLLMLSKMPTRFRFNGVEVSLTPIEGV